MKEDLSLNQLCDKVKSLAALKKDFLVNTDDMCIHANQAYTTLQMNGKHFFLQETAERQLASLCGMPYPFIQRLGKSHPNLLEVNYNTLLGDVHKTRLVRTMDRYTRAILSDRYKKFEHENILETLMPILDNTSGLSIVSSSITPEKMYIKIISEKETVDVNVGDAVSFGAVITNSEVGLGSITITPFCMRLVCTNGMALPKYSSSSRRIHLGKQINSIDEYENERYSFESLFATMKENLHTALDSMHYMKVVEKMRIATQIKIVEPIDTITRVAKYYGLSEEEHKAVTVHFLAAKDQSLYGLANAVTRTAQDAITYIRASELEKIGSDVLYDGVKSANKNESPVLGLIAA